MAVKKADEYQHNNPNNAFVDSSFVRGGRRTVPNRAGLYALADKADQLLQDVTIVRVKVDALYSNAATNLLLIDINQIGSPAGWQIETVPVAPGGGDVSKAYVDQQDGLLRADINELTADLTDAENDINALENTAADHETRLDALEAGTGGAGGAGWFQDSFTWTAAQPSVNLPEKSYKLDYVMDASGTSIIPPNRQPVFTSNPPTLTITGGALEGETLYYGVSLGTTTPPVDPGEDAYVMGAPYSFNEPYTV